MANGRLAIGPVVVALVAACRGHHDEGPPPLGKALTAAMAAADEARVPWQCAALDTPALVPGTLGAWTTDEHALELGAGKPQVTIAIVADTGGAAPATLAALARLRTKLDGADLVITLGGMGATQPELEAVLGTLADKAVWPVVALPGDLEPEPQQQAAIAALEAKGDLVVDGRQVRWIRGDGFAIATAPGAGAIERLVAGADGCAWRASDVAKVYAELDDQPGIRVVATAEAPREGATGELALVPAKGVDVVVHGGTALSQARQGGRDGTHVALSPGTADAMPRLPETRAPSAGLLVIRGTTWSWRPLTDER